MRVKLHVNYGKHAYGSIVDLSEKELLEVGEKNYVEVGEEVEVSEKEASDCSELQTELESAKEAIATKDSQLAERDGEIVDLKKEIESAAKAFAVALSKCKKLDDLKALQAKYPKE